MMVAAKLYHRQVLQCRLCLSDNVYPFVVQTMPEAAGAVAAGAVADRLLGPKERLKLAIILVIYCIFPHDWYKMLNCACILSKLLAVKDKSIHWFLNWTASFFQMNLRASTIEDGLPST